MGACYIFHTDVNLHVAPVGLPSASGLQVPGDYSPVSPELTHFFFKLQVICFLDIIQPEKEKYQSECHTVMRF